MKNKFEKILKNNSHVNMSILEILIGIKARKNEPEEQLLLNAKYIIPILTIKNWSTWCELMNSKNMKPRLEHQMNQIIVYDPTENLSYLIKKVLDQDRNQNKINNLNHEYKIREEITESQNESLEWRELNKMYLLHSYDLDLKEDDIHFTPKNRQYLKKNMIIITMRPKEEPEKIPTHLYNSNINNLQIWNKEERNNLAGIYCNISINEKSVSTIIIGMLDTGARANLISYDTYEKALKEN